MEIQWPVLSYNQSKETYQTVHLWCQVIGKIKLATLPWVNHSWHVTLAVTPTGLTTGTLMQNNSYFQIDFDFVDHKLNITTNEGSTKAIELKQMSVSAFYEKVMQSLNDLNISINIHTTPNEIENAIPFEKDDEHNTYNPNHIRDLHHALLNTNYVLTLFRSEFIGKCSPVHFFWGSFDIAVSRFSGNKAPRHPGGIPNLPDWVAQEAYSHEVSSCGFWPGNESFQQPAFYSYVYPEPENIKDSSIKPKQAYFHNDLHEFILPYEDIQTSTNSIQTLLDFFRSTYEEGTRLAHWKRGPLEKKLNT